VRPVRIPVDVLPLAAADHADGTILVVNDDLLALVHGLAAQE